MSPEQLRSPMNRRELLANSTATASIALARPQRGKESDERAALEVATLG